MPERELKEKRHPGKPGPYCGKCAYREEPLLESGGPSGGTMLVGEGTRYAGFSSQRLTRQLAQAGLRLADCWLDNVVQCKVPATRKPTKTAVRCCRPLLEEHLAKCAPRRVITLGAEAFAAFYAGLLRSYHGSRLQGDGYELVPMYKPDAFDDNPDLLKVLSDDYRGLKNRPILEPIAGDYCLQSERCSFRASNDRFAVDTETTGLDLRSAVLGVAYSDSPGSATYIPLEKHLRVKGNIRDSVVMHNAKYDTGVLDSSGLITFDKWGNLDDTMLLAYCMNRRGLGLKALAIQELGLEMRRFEDVADEKKSLAGVDVADVAEYSGADADATLRLWEHLWRSASTRERNLYEKAEKPLPMVLAKMQLAGVLVDTGYFEKLGREMGGALEDMQAEMLKGWKLEPETLSSPTALAKWLKTLLGHAVESTDHETLKSLKKENPVIEKIDAWRILFKLKTSFVDSLLSLQKGGILFPQFNQCGTRIGRLSSHDPNLQQTPKRMDKTIRKGFPAMPGTVVCAIDNSQLDLRCLAWLSQDQKLMRIFEADVDIHDEAAMEMFGKIDPDRRWLAKMCNFIVSYGGGPGALSRKTDLPEEQTSAFLEKYWETYSGVKAWVAETHKTAYRDGYAEDLFGRRCYFPALYTRKRGRGERQAQNFPPSGSSADIMKMQLAAASRLALPFATVHDELDFYLPEKEWRGIVPELVKAMEGIDCPFPVACEASIGPTLGTLKKWDHKAGQFKAEKKVERDADLVAASKM